MTIAEQAEQHSCALYLLIEAGPPAEDRLRAILETQFVPTVLIKPSGDGELDAKSTHPLVEVAQHYGTAALLADAPALTRTLRADGCHLSHTTNIIAKFEDARDILGNRYIIGASLGKSRDAAMLLGELGADYIAFGAPSTLQDQDKATSTRGKLIEWWAELFEIPCVAFDVATTNDAIELAARGADFVTVTVLQGMSPADAAESVRELTALLEAQHAEASL